LKKTASGNKVFNTKGKLIINQPDYTDTGSN
jgi:hypothetical protein